MIFIYEGSVCSDLLDTRDFIANILEKVKKVINDEDLIFDLKLILNELIINGVIHGNKSCKDKCVKLYLEISDETLKVEVCDEGEGIRPDGCYNPEDLKSCGRGLLLVDGLSDELLIDNNKITAFKLL